MAAISGSGAQRESHGERRAKREREREFHRSGSFPAHHGDRGRAGNDNCALRSSSCLSRPGASATTRQRPVHQDRLALTCFTLLCLFAAEGRHTIQIFWRVPTSHSIGQHKGAGRVGRGGAGSDRGKPFPFPSGVKAVDWARCSRRHLGAAGQHCQDRRDSAGRIAAGRSEGGKGRSLEPSVRYRPGIARKNDLRQQPVPCDPVRKGGWRRRAGWSTIAQVHFLTRANKVILEALSFDADGALLSGERFTILSFPGVRHAMRLFLGPLAVHTGCDPNGRSSRRCLIGRGQAASGQHGLAVAEPV